MIAVSTKPAAARPKQFDTAKFETMVEPFTIRIEKIKGTMKMFIPLPQPEDGTAPGTGWAKDQIRDVERWLVSEWAGGGHYLFAITDSSSPPQAMEWVAFYPITEFPEKVPPTLQGAFLPTAPPPTPQAKSMASFPGSGSSLPPASLYPQVPMPVMPAPSPSYYPAPVPYGYATPLGGGASSAANETAMLREQLARAREEAQARDFERRLSEIKAESEKQMQALQQSMHAMVQQMTQAMQAQHKPIDTQAVQHAETIRRLEDQLRAQQAEAERARRESELRDEIRRTQEAQARLVEESNRRLEAFMAANANKGPDPQVMMFQQMMAAQMDAMKEMARASQAQLDRVQNHIMRPQDILAIAKESQSSTDHVVGNISRQYESMFALSRQLIEQAAQLNQGGGGNEVIGLVRDVGANLAEMARKYTGDKSKEAVAQMNAQAEIAKAQAEVQKSQLAQMAHMAAMEAAAKQGNAAMNAAHVGGAAVRMPNGAYAAPGAPQPAIGAPRAKGTAKGSGLNGAPSNVVPIKQAPDDGQRRIKGRTDLEWFGPALANVNQLRAEVAKFITALSETPPRKDGCSPEEAATIIHQAVAEIMQRQIAIPAMVDLAAQGMVADFLDVLLPDAPQAYRDDVAKLLVDGIIDDDDDEDDEDDEDGEQPQAG